jgi:hypothetical protein
MDADTIKNQRLIAKLMSASVPVEELLQQGKPLTAQQFESLSLTIAGLQTFLEAWKRKNKVSPLDESFLNKFQPHTARYRFSGRVRRRPRTKGPDAVSKKA